MTMYDKFKKLDINFSRLGLEQGDAYGGYFCTPKGAKVIGCEGVDGIHYCFVKGFGEMVFTVNPSNLPGEYVHPLARSFEDFLRLLLACGSTAALEQAWMWNRGEFDAFLETYPPDPEQRVILDIIRDKLSLTSMENPYEYIKEIQSTFDYKQIQYSKEYYDLVFDEPETQELPESPEWKVYFEVGFYGWHSGHDKPGAEIPVNKTFTWGGRTWHIPAVYSCGKGLVVDFCVEIDPAGIKNFLDKWNPLWEEDRPLTPEEEEQQDAENPMRVDFDSKVTVNGRKLRPSRGSVLDWVPMSCRPKGRCWDNRDNSEAFRLMEHYGLDAELGWVYRRQSFPWATRTKPKLNTLSVSLEQRRQPVPGLRFSVRGAGDMVTFTHPLTGETHTLQVMEYENREADLSCLPADGWEYPTHYVSMSYAVEPDLPRESLTVWDCGQGDTPRNNTQKQTALAPIISVCEPAASGSVGIIGGADGPTAVFLTNGKTGCPRTVCSALRFEVPEQIEWRIVFLQKTAENMEIDLTLPR